MVPRRVTRAVRGAGRFSAVALSAAMLVFGAATGFTKEEALRIVAGFGGAATGSSSGGS